MEKVENRFSVYVIKLYVSKETFNYNVSENLLKDGIEISLDLAFAHILRLLLHFFKYLLGYFGYDLCFGLDEVKIEDAAHGLPLHLPFVTLGEDQSITCDELERSDGYIICGLDVTALIMLLVKLSDELWIN